jgi:hypothetical protein
VRAQRLSLYRVAVAGYLLAVVFARIRPGHAVRRSEPLLRIKSACGPSIPCRYSYAFSSTGMLVGSGYHPVIARPRVHHIALGGCRVRAGVKEAAPESYSVAVLTCAFVSSRAQLNLALAVCFQNSVFAELVTKLAGVSGCAANQGVVALIAF